MLKVDTTATKLEPGSELAWNWSDGTNVNVTIKELDGAAAITLINAGFSGKDQ